MSVSDQLSRRTRPSTGTQQHDVSLKWISGADEGPASWRELGDLDWSQFRLVLGAGGATGAAFEAGILLALATDHGVDLQQAKHVVGTSAGSVVGALIAMGLGVKISRPSSHAARVAVAGRRFVRPDVRRGDSTATEPAPPRPTDGRPRPRAVRRPGGDTTLPSAVAALPQARHVRPHPTAAIHTWARVAVECSAHRLCADSATGDRVVFERDSGANLADAVAASCAVPGVMRPVAIGDRLLVDGGVVSPTNADLALDDGDSSVTVIVAPMSGTGAHSALGRASSMFASKRLLSELRRSDPSGGVLVIDRRRLSARWCSTTHSTRPPRHGCSLVRSWAVTSTHHTARRGFASNR